jgi:hypothetical protein
VQYRPVLADFFATESLMARFGSGIGNMGFLSEQKSRPIGRMRRRARPMRP